MRARCGNRSPCALAASAQAMIAPPIAVAIEFTSARLREYQYAAALSHDTHAPITTTIDHAGRIGRLTLRPLQTRGQRRSQLTQRVGHEHIEGRRPRHPASHLP
jgi:hypothetical protein